MIFFFWIAIFHNFKQTSRNIKTTKIKNDNLFIEIQKYLTACKFFITHENLWYFCIMCRERVYIIRLVWLTVCGLWCYIGILMNQNAYLKQKKTKINKFHLFLDFFFTLISFDSESCKCFHFQCYGKS